MNRHQLNVLRLMLSLFKARGDISLDNHDLRDELSDIEVAYIKEYFDHSKVYITLTIQFG